MYYRQNIYFWEKEKPHVVKRRCGGKNIAAEAVQNLLEGSSFTEEKEEIHTEIPKGTRLLNLSQKGKLVKVDLSREFEGAEPDLAIDFYL